MKVAIVLPNSGAPNVHYYNSQELGLGKGLTQIGISVEIFQYSSKCGFRCRSENHAESQTIQITQFGGISVPGNQAMSLGLFWHLWRARKSYSIIQVHDNTQILATLIALFGKCIGLPILLYQGMYQDLRGVKGRIHQAIQRILNPILAASVSKVVAKTQYAANYIEEQLKLPSQSVPVISVGLDVENFKIASSNLTRSIDLLYVGKLEPRRNTEFLSLLIQRLVRATPQLRITVIGDGPDASSFQKSNMDLIRSGSLRYISRVPNQELAEFYSHSKALLFPTKYEIFGMSVLEAMYFGCIPFASAEAGPQAIITPRLNGFLFEDFEIRNWMDCIQSVLNAPEQMGIMANNAHNTILTEHSWSTISQKFSPLYRELSKESHD